MAVLGRNQRASRGRQATIRRLHREAVHRMAGAGGEFESTLWEGDGRAGEGVLRSARVLGTGEEMRSAARGGGSPVVLLVLGVSDSLIHICLLHIRTPVGGARLTFLTFIANIS